MTLPMTQGDIIDAQREEIENLRADLAQARAQLAAAHAGRDQGLAGLQRVLRPLYLALQQVFGELDAIGVPETETVSDTSRWADWKRRLGPSCAKVIDALLLEPNMNVTGLTIACKMAKQTVYDATSKMGRAGILVSEDGRYSLKR